MNLVTAFNAAAASDGKGIHFVLNGEEEVFVSYTDLYERALAVLGALQRKGVRAGNEVVIRVGNNQQLLPVFWACLLGKMIPVPLSTENFPAHKLRLLTIWESLHDAYWVGEEADKAGIREAAVAAGSEEAFLAPASRFIPVDSLFTATEKGRLASIDSNDIAYIQFSSGSTGTPKGVCLTHENLVYNVRDIIKSLAITNDDILLSWMPLTHDMGMIGFHLTGLLMNIPVVSIPASVFVRRPLLWMDKTAHHRATVLYSPNFGLHYFLKALRKGPVMNWDLSCVRILVNGAEPIQAALCQDFTSTLATYQFPENAITTAYGLAEASVAVAVMPVRTRILDHHLHRQYLYTGQAIQLLEAGDQHAAAFVDVGYPVAHCQVRIADEADASLPEKHIGHIQIKGPNVTKGYYNNAPATAELFTAGGWLRTGDLGWLMEGRLVITGRLKDMIILHGQNYYSSDLEQVLIAKGITENGMVAACGVVHPAKGSEELVVFVLHKDKQQDLAAITQAIRDALFAAMGLFVHQVVPVSKIPKTTSGKIQRYYLVRQYLAGEYGVQHETDATTITSTITPAILSTEQLLTVVRELTGQPAIAADTKIMDTGMNSLLSVQLANRLERLTGKPVPASAIFNGDNFETLTHFINNAQAVDALPVMSSTVAASYYSLSKAQGRIWMECQLAMDPVGYHVPVVHTLQGPLDVNLLQDCMQVLLQRYEILRTAFELREERPVQVVHAYNSKMLHWHTHDLRHTDDPITAAAAILHAALHQPFRMDMPGLYRVVLTRMGEEEYQLIWVLHHIITDGWSLSILFKELSELYNNTGRALHPVAYQYRDYCAWQEELLKSRFYQRDHAYWAAELKQLPPAVGLSMQEKSSPGFEALPAAPYTYSLNAAEWVLLQQLARDSGTTPFVVVMSLLNTLLYRYTNSQDIVLAFDVAGRSAQAHEHLVGYLINTLLLRTAINGQQSFREVVDQVHYKTGMALRHQWYPFEDLLKAHAGRKLFKVLVLYQDFYTQFKGLELHPCSSRQEQAWVEQGFTDLVLEFSLKGETPAINISYHTGLYEQPAIEALCLHFSRLLAAVAEDPGNAIAQYHFFTASEQAFLSPDNRKQPALLQLGMPVHQQFEWRAAATPTLPAIIAGSTTLSYQQLNEQANRLAWHIRTQFSIRPDDTIGFTVTRNQHIVLAILAILKSGAGYVPIDHQFPATRCESMVAGSGMKCLLTDTDNLARVQQWTHAPVILNLDDSAIYADNLTNPAYTGSPDHLAYILYTSGSTGVPKGVMITHRSLTHYVHQFANYFGITKQDRCIQQSSVAFDTLAEEIFPVLCNSGTVIIDPEAGRDIEGLIALIDQHKATILSTTPLVLQEINRQVDERIDSLRLLISGGDVLQGAYINRLLEVAAIYNTYGPTETTICAAWHRVTKAEDAGIIGKPVYGYDIWIMDENLQPMPYGKAGELCIEGGSARGYLHLPELTAQKFVAAPFDTARTLYRSGDYGYWNEQGQLVFLGRLDNQVKYRGYRIELEEIERVMSRYPGMEAAAVVLPDKGILTAFLVAGADFSKEKLQAWLGRELPYYMLPGSIEQLDKLPLTVSGKTDRAALTRLALTAKQVATEVNAPSTEMERLLMELLLPVLQLTSMSTDSNIFELGCDSIKATRLLNGILHETGVTLKLSDVFIHPTIRQLSAVLERQAATYIIELE